MDILIIILGIIAGGFYALCSFLYGKLGTQGTVEFNNIKSVLCMVVGGIYGGFFAYTTGGLPSAEIITAWIIGFSFSGFGLIWFIDFATTMIIGFLNPKSAFAKSMAIPKGG